MRRRRFLGGLAGAALAWPFSATAQQQTLPVIGMLNAASPDNLTDRLRAFRRGLAETGYIEGQNVAIEYYSTNELDQLPALAADLVRRGVKVIAVPGSAAAALAAKAATQTIPIAFGIPEDPVKLGLVASLPRPGGNASGINFYSAEVNAKRLGLLNEMVPTARRIAVLVNPANVMRAQTAREDLSTAARVLGLQLEFYEATSNKEIDTAYAALLRDRPGALFVAADVFFSSRRVQLASLAARHALPASYSSRETVEVGGLMSYGTSILDMIHHVGTYSGRMLKGEKPADLPVVQSSKFELAINQQTARLLDINVPPMLLARADEVIE